MSTPSPRHIQTLYLGLLLLSTLAASFIWGVNTLFLLDAGLSNTQAFLANTFFTLGQVVFEVPTGLIADIKGRRASYLLGTLTLAASTLLYLGAWWVHAPLLWWAISSILLGLGFTFFSGATEAWLVDALEFAGYKGSLEAVFAKGQMVAGVAMLAGAVGGGALAQATNLSLPYLVRTVLLVVTFVIAFIYMKDWGFEPTPSVSLAKEAKALFVKSFLLSWENPALRWMVLAAPFTAGVGFYAFYAMQPHLLKLYGDEKAYTVAGLAAAIVAGSQILGGALVPQVKKWFTLRTSAIITAVGVSSLVLALVGLTSNFWVAIGLLCLWGLVSALSRPIRQAYVNQLIPSKQRATVLSFDSLVSSSGGAVIQPLLGLSADVWSYGSSFMVGALIQMIALPWMWLAKIERSPADKA